jgi:hypothetical protein
MRAWGDGHVVAGYRGGASPRWREAAAVAAGAALPLTVTNPFDLAELGQPLDSFIAGHDHGADQAPRTVPAP